MTTNVFSSKVKKLTTNWYSKNEAGIAKGMTVSTPSEFLAYERGLFLMLVQLGAPRV